MAERDGDRAFWSGVQSDELPHCGACDPVTRQLEDGQRVIRCPRCHPLQDELLAQTWRCPVCHALIYRDQRGLPCSAHRTVDGWHRDYDLARSGAAPMLPNPVTEAGATAARALLAARPRPDEPPPGAPPGGDPELPF